MFNNAKYDDENLSDFQTYVSVSTIYRKEICPHVTFTLQFCEVTSKNRLEFKGSCVEAHPKMSPNRY